MRVVEKGVEQDVYFNSIAAQFAPRAQAPSLTPEECGAGYLKRTLRRCRQG